MQTILANVVSGSRCSTCEANLNEPSLYHTVSFEHLVHAKRMDAEVEGNQHPRGGMRLRAWGHVL